MKLEKIEKLDIIFALVILFMILGSMFIPKTGKAALADNFVKLLFLWSIVIYAWYKLLKIKENRRKIIIIIYIICTMIVIFAILKSKDLITDFISGPKEITLYDVTVSQYTGSKGFISQHYYLNGYDSEGNRHTIQISGDDYDTVVSGKQITITYYEHINRLYKLGGVK